MTQPAKKDDAAFVAAKWLVSCSLLVVVVTVAIWIDMNDRPQRSKTRSSLSGARQGETLDPRVRDPEVTVSEPRLQRPRSRAIAFIEDDGDALEAPSSHEEPTDEELEAQRYERNDRSFEERLARLEQELEEGRRQDDTNEVLSAHLTALLAQTTKIPTNVKTRCSQSVCEISFVGEGSAFDFATAAATGLASVAHDAARGPAMESVREAFDRDSAVQPTEQRPPQRADDAPDGLSSPAVALRSIRYLVPIDDLKLTPPSGIEPTEPTPASSARLQ